MRPTSENGTNCMLYMPEQEDEQKHTLSHTLNEAIRKITPENAVKAN